MHYYNRQVPFESLKGKTITMIEGGVGSKELKFYCGDSEYVMYHDQNCCESVGVDDIIGNLTDLIDSPILDAREESSRENPAGVTKDYQDSFTWTFYILATIKGSVTIRWYGGSNGYYSESVDFAKIK